MTKGSRSIIPSPAEAAAAIVARDMGPSCTACYLSLRQCEEEHPRCCERCHHGPVPNLLCNRSACRAPGPRWWNASTRAFYCAACAEGINHYSPGLCREVPL